MKQCADKDDDAVSFVVVDFERSENSQHSNVCIFSRIVCSQLSKFANIPGDSILVVMVPSTDPRGGGKKSIETFAKH